MTLEGYHVSKDITYERTSHSVGRMDPWAIYQRKNILGRTSFNKRTSLTKGYHFYSGTYFSETDVGMGDDDTPRRSTFNISIWRIQWTRSPTRPDARIAPAWTKVAGD